MCTGYLGTGISGPGPAGFSRIAYFKRSSRLDFSVIGSTLIPEIWKQDDLVLVRPVLAFNFKAQDYAQTGYPGSGPVNFGIFGATLVPVI